VPPGHGKAEDNEAAAAGPEEAVTGHIQEGDVPEEGAASWVRVRDEMVATASGKSSHPSGIQPTSGPTCHLSKL